MREDIATEFVTFVFNEWLFVFQIKINAIIEQTNIAKNLPQRRSNVPTGQFSLKRTAALD